MLLETRLSSLHFHGRQVLGFQRFSCSFNYYLQKPGWQLPTQFFKDQKALMCYFVGPSINLTNIICRSIRSLDRIFVGPSGISHTEDPEEMTMATAEQRKSATKAIASEVFAFFRKFPSMRKGNVRLVIRRRSRLSFLRSVNFREEKEYSSVSCVD